MFSHLFRNFQKIAWFLPGFLLWAAFPPMGERMDVLFALAPLMWLSRREVSARIVAKRWFQSGIFYWGATLSWMPAIVKNGGPWPLVVLGWFCLAAYCAAYFAAYGWLSAIFWKWARKTSDNRTVGQSNNPYWKRLLGVLLVEPLLWCGLELVRSRFLGGFAWNQLGVVPVNSGFGAPAALGGVYLCSAVVVLINGTIAGIAERVWKAERSGFANLKRLGSLETLVVFGAVYGIYSCASLASGEDTASPLGGGANGEAVFSPLQGARNTFLKVAMIQRNFACVFKAQEENPLDVYGKLFENVAELKPDLVVLPESALCEFAPVDQPRAAAFAEWVRDKTGAALLAGGSRYSHGLNYNSAALYSTKGVQVYDKVHLVPFGEFIPGDKLFPALQKFAPVGSCTPGELKLLSLSLPDGANDRTLPSADNQTVKQSNAQTIPLGVAICFEDTDSAQVRALVKKGAQALVFVTNDSWFSHSIESEQHAWQAVARAIETGLPVVRVGNGGVTGTIAPEGRATWLVGSDGKPLVDRRGTMFDRIEVKNQCEGRPRTPYVVLGDLPLALAFALLILGMIVVKYSNNYEKRRSLSL